VPCQLTNHSPRSASQSLENVVRTMASVLTSQTASPPRASWRPIPAKPAVSSVRVSRQFSASSTQVARSKAPSAGSRRMSATSTSAAGALRLARAAISGDRSHAVTA
jgi:hypothetical protein